MFCKYCGNELPESANFCPKCGKINEDASKDERTNTNSPITFDEQLHSSFEYEQEDPFRKEKDELGGSILKFAILGLAFGSTMWLSLLGLIFSIIARTKVKEYIAKFHKTENRATVGNGLSIAGLIVSIVFTCIMTILILVSIPILI